jgi:hypothetical protein
MAKTSCGVYYNPLTEDIVGNDCTKKEFDNIKQACGSQLVYFPSAFEFETFEVIKKHIPTAAIKIHPQVLIKPATRNWKEIKTTLDFKLNLTYYKKLSFDKQQFKDFAYIDCKSYFNRDYLIKLQLLDSFYPDVHNQLIICYDNHNKNSQQQIKSIQNKCPGLNLITLEELDLCLRK